ncbi:MAG TPA: hypothetical protein VEV45_10045 [Streptosporangiaceae bacterium]|nr:hypothetical protein [Streptosporangiaceae bacterium]
MRRAHDRSSENQVGQQGDVTGTGPGTTSGAAATGRSTTGRETDERYSTGTTYEQGRQPAAYGRTGQAPAADYGRSSMETGTSTSQGGLFLVLAGLLTFLVGLAFVVRHGFYTSHGLYAYNWGIVQWGWVLFGLGIATFAVGACHLLGIPWSRPVGIAMAVLTVVAGFMIVPFYPLWGIIVVALGIAAVWGLAHGAERHESERREYEYERDRQMSRM